MSVSLRNRVLKQTLEGLAQVVSVDEITVEGDIIQSISVVTKTIGKLTVSRLDLYDAPRL